MVRRLIAAVDVAASAALVVPGTPLVGTASAEFFLVSREARAGSTPTTYTLTEQERANACGNFAGSIIFTDGSSLDCSTGVATLPSA